MNKTFLSANWEHLIMANYAVNPSLLEPYLPNGVELDYFNNQTYVSLVGFLFKNTRLFNIPIPMLGTFEEINLRFYVKRTEGKSVKRGVVFINETVPYKIVAFIANKLYKEHYTAIPTKNTISIDGCNKKVNYEWKINKSWNHLSVEAAIERKEMLTGSMEEFIFEHYYGYTKISELATQEYKVNHPRWLVNEIQDYSINCDFRSMYGDKFDYLKNEKPHSVIIAEGSSVNVDWNRTKF
jgi:uncharacterized protein YqjF (DUF2071 family)